ncbi:MAG: Ig-like domain-containing protein [Planctomycetota bacterium]
MKNLRQLLRRVRPTTSRGGGGSRGNQQLKRRLLSQSLESRQLLAGDVGETAEPELAMAHNYWNAFDVNNDKAISAIDALTVINHINRAGAAGEMITDQSQFEAFVDVNGDHQVTALDALQVVNAINAGAGEDMDDLVELVLSARDIETDELISNTQGVTDVLPTDSQVIEYNVTEGDIFKLEIAVKDLRGASANGVFQVVADLVIDQSGVLEPAIGEVQTIVFNNDILDFASPQTGTIEFFYEGDESNVVSRPLEDFTTLSTKTARQNFVSDRIIELQPSVTSRDDVLVDVTINPSAGAPAGTTGGSVTTTVVYTTPDLANQNLPQLVGRVTIDNVEQPSDITSTEVFEPGSTDFNSQALVENFEYFSRNADDLQIYGQDRGFGEFVVGDNSDEFNEIGALGPLQVLPEFFETAREEFDFNVAYDAFSIPVRAIAPASNVSVALNVSDDDEGILIYGTDAGKETVPESMIAFDETSRLILNVAPDQTGNNITADDTTVSVAEDTVGGISVDLDTLVNATTTSETINYSIGTLTPDTGSVSLDNGVVTYTPDPDFFGDGTTLTYTASNTSDGSDTGTLTFNVTPVNDLTVVDDADSTDAGVEVEIDVLANDSAGPANEGESLTITGVSGLTSEQGIATFNNGQVQFTPNAALETGEVAFQYTVTDGTDSATGTIRVQVTAVNEPITFTNQTVSVDEDSGANVVVADLNTFTVTDPVGGTVTFSDAAVATGTGTAQLSGSELTYTPADNEFGDAAATITFTATSGGDSTTGTVTINIASINDIPTDGVNIFTVPEGTTALLDVLDGASPGPANESDQVLSIAGVTQPDVGSVSISGTQIEFVAPDGVGGGTTDFTYTLSDNTGGVNETDVISVSVQFSEVLDAPDATNLTVNIDEDSGESQVDLDTLVNLDTGDSVTFTLVTTSSDLGTVSLDGSTLSFTPDADEFGTASFTYRATSTVGEMLSDEGIVTFEVAAINDAPVAAENLFETISENTTVDVDVVTPGSDVDDPDSSLTPVIVTGPTAAQGTATVVGDSIRFTPTTDFIGTVTIDYQLDDGNATNNLSNVATLTIVVTDVILAPQAGDGAITAAEDGSGTLDLETVTTSDPGEATTYSLTTTLLAFSGSVVVNGSVVTYTPVADFFGTDSFTYQASNSSGSTEATVTVTVTSVNDPPTAEDDSASVVKNTSVSIDVLDNDSPGPANEGQTLTITDLSTPTRGTVAVVDGEIVYTPNTDEIGDDTFTYTVSDGVTTTTADVDVTIQDFEASTISGRLFVDAVMNTAEVIASGGSVAPFRDGTYEDGESVLGGVRVTLRNASGEALVTTFTRVDGTYEFTNVAPGDYDVEFDLPPDAFGVGDSADGSVSNPIGAAGGEDDTQDVVLFTLGRSAHNNVNHVSTQIGDGELITLEGGATILLSEFGSQLLFQTSRGFDMVDFAELNLSANNDTALLTIVRDVDTGTPIVETAQISSDHLRISDDGALVQLLGGYNDFVFQQDIDALVEAEYPGFRDGIDEILDDLS